MEDPRGPHWQRDLRAVRLEGQLACELLSRGPHSSTLEGGQHRLLQHDYGRHQQELQQDCFERHARGGQEPALKGPQPRDRAAAGIHKEQLVLPTPPPFRGSGPAESGRQ